MDRNSPAADNGVLNLSSLSIYRNAVYGVAAIWIVMFHGVILKNIEFPPELSFIEGAFEFGRFGVDIFVLLSGIGLYFSFSKKPKLTEFYHKRFVRVYLPYLIIAVPYLVYACLIIDSNVGLFIRSVLTVNFWTGETKPLDLWYVSAILVFYLLYPLIHRFIYKKEKGELLRALVLIAIVIAISILLYYFFYDAFSRLSRVLPRLAVFILGCYLGKLVKEKRRISPWILVICGVVVIGAYPLYGRAMIRGVYRWYYGSLTGVALNILMAQAFVFLSRIKLDKLFSFFGGFSLEIYIATIVARMLFVKTPLYDENAWGNYLIVMAGAILIAFLISLLERPIIKKLLKQ